MRVDLVGDVGARAKRVNYSGVILKTPDGRVVGEWYANGKVEVIPDAAAGAS